MRLSRRLGVYGSKKKTVKYKGSDTLDKSMFSPATARVGDYAIFQGDNVSGGDSTVSAVNHSLTVTYLHNYQTMAADMSKGASLPSYAAFITGYKGDIYKGAAYDSSLTTTDFYPSNNIYLHGGVAVIGDYAIWAGGLTSQGASTKYTIAFDNSLTEQSIDYLSSYMDHMAYGTTKDSGAELALFYEGDNCDSFDSSLSHSSVNSSVDSICTYTSVEFNGNIIYPNFYDNGSLYSISGSGTVSLLPASEVSQCKHISGTSINNKVIIFAGGGTTDYAPSSQEVYVYDKSFTQSIVDGLSQSRLAPGATSIGNIALFGGGSTSYSEPEVASSNGYSEGYNTLDAYEFS